MQVLHNSVYFLFHQRLFASTFCHFMIKPFFMSISVASISEVFHALFSQQVNTLPFLTVAMFETKAILSQVTLHNPVLKTTDAFFL